MGSREAKLRICKANQRDKAANRSCGSRRSVVISTEAKLFTDYTRGLANVSPGQTADVHRNFLLLTWLTYGPQSLIARGMGASQ